MQWLGMYRQSETRAGNHQGTHARETPAYQRRPRTLHEVQGSNPPIRALYMQLAKITHIHQTTPCATSAPGADKPPRHPPGATGASPAHTQLKTRRRVSSPAPESALTCCPRGCYNETRWLRTQRQSETMLSGISTAQEFAIFSTIAPPFSMQQFTAVCSLPSRRSMGQERTTWASNKPVTRALLRRTILSTSEAYGGPSPVAYMHAESVPAHCSIT